MAPVTIHYQETAFTVPMLVDRQAMHQRVYDVVTNGQHQDRRDFVFDLLPIDAESTLALATVRSIKFSDEIPAEDKSLTVRHGDDLRIRVRLASVRRPRSAEGKSVAQRVTPGQLEEWFTDLLARKGMNAEDVRVVDKATFRVDKEPYPFIIPAVRYSATVTIDNPVSFATAFLSGVGRHKGYGLGLLEVETE